MKKRICAVFCALLLLFICTNLSFAETSNAVYILAVNDKFCDFNGTHPVALNTSIYIPYTVFDKNATGYDLGVYYGLIKGEDLLLTLYSNTDSLQFTVDKNVCVDSEGNEQGFRAYTQNGIPYIPAAEVCDFFGLTYSLVPTSDRGTLIRISDPKTVFFTDRQFLSLGAGAMLNRYNEIVQTIIPGSIQTEPPVPVQTASHEGPTSKKNVYLAIDASEADDVLSDSFQEGVYGLFLFTPESLTTRASQVRKAVAAGHSIGLIVEGSEEEIDEQLEQGNQLLAHIARIHTHIVAAPEELTNHLEEQGWICWQSDVAYDTAREIMDGLSGQRGDTHIELPPTESVIRRVIRDTRREGYTIQRPLETNL